MWSLFSSFSDPSLFHSLKADELARQLQLYFENLPANRTAVYACVLYGVRLYEPAERNRVAHAIMAAWDYATVQRLLRQRAKPLCVVAIPIDDRNAAQVASAQY